MQPVTRRIFLLLLLLLGLGWIHLSRSLASPGSSGARTAPQVGFPAPDFSLETLDQHTVSLADLQGRPVVLNFWASWCPPCRAEMPSLEKVQQEYSGQGLVVLAIAAANQDDLANITAFVNDQQLSMTIPLDTQGSVAASYEVRSLPTSFFIDRNGIIREIVIGGPMSEASLRSRIDTLLEETP